MRVLFLSTYELGQQPVNIAGPAAAVEARGHETRLVDLSRSPWPDGDVAWAQAVAISIPMHTATRLALEVLRALRDTRPDLCVALYGLYAPVVEGHDLLRPGDLLPAGDPTAAISSWLEGMNAPLALDGEAPISNPRAQVDLGSPRPTPSPLPLRHLLPPLEGYAHLRAGERDALVASVEASRGCNHKCRHCPVAPVWNGRSRPVAIASVLADIDQVAAAGATHVSFADPDFLNRPGHALEVARALHAAHPELTFDATVKVEHVLKHRAGWPELASSGLIFIVSAFESVDDHVLERLDKGHTATDEAEAVAIVRGAGIEVRPSWLPFTPWTTLESFAALLNFAAKSDLVWSTDPVQYSIRLLLPRGSLLLSSPDAVLAAALEGGEDAYGSRRWVPADSAVDDLQREVASRAELGSAAAEDLDVTFQGIWEIARAAGAPLATEPPAPSDPWLPGPERPRLTESWFCCAEPTLAQRTGLDVPLGAL
jgi:hypothetical protein